MKVIMVKPTEKMIGNRVINVKYIETEIDYYPLVYALAKKFNGENNIVPICENQNEVKLDEKIQNT